ncbi:MAG TPA: 2TM domain-containing protein, partial [Polyangiaceae bacterium]
MSKNQGYADDEVREIIERALKDQPASGVSHEDLLSIGAGVGLSRSAMESAAREVTEGRLTETARKRIVSRRRRGVAAHAFVYLAVNALLFAVNFLTTPGQWWVLFPVFFWGLALLLHLGFGLSSQVSERRLAREKQRLLSAAGAGVASLV